MKKAITILIFLFCFSPVFAKKQKPPPPLSCVYITAAEGYGVISGMYQHDGEFAQARLAFGVDFASWEKLTFSAEAGAQSGNTMRLSVDQTILNAAGGLPIQTTLKPFLDFLFAGKLQCKECLCFFLKGGVAFRQLQLNDRTSSRDSLRRINGELQAGICCNVSRHARFLAYYQGIYSGSNAKVRLDSSNNILLGQIPTQNGGFIGIEYTF